jgi:N6-L-threonylcarbamoyladenine synthase
MRILALETSCDDTSVAVVESPGRVQSLCSASQDSFHQPFGGVVPEIASRNHTLKILPLVEEALLKAGLRPANIDGIAVTSRPGLIGALMVGVVTAKSLALAWKKPLLAVNHLVGHLYAPFLQDDHYQPAFREAQAPYLALTVSGGHSALYIVEEFGRFHLLGKTLDDAAGEAFDKLAKMVGLGYPGGAHVDRVAQSGRSNAFEFPRPLLNEDNLIFSFSGLKSAAHRLISQMSVEELQIAQADLCASYQEAVVECLIGKLMAAQKQTGIRHIVITGGVSANSRLRAKAQEWASRDGLTLAIPPIRFCTDNAAMIGLVGLLQLERGLVADQALSPQPGSLPGEFIMGFGQ